MQDEVLRQCVRNAVGEFFAACHAPRWDAPFIPGETPVPVSGKLYDGEDMAGHGGGPRFLAYDRTVCRGFRKEFFRIPRDQAHQS
ncbi:MAG: hypothetical protein WC560_12520, partial [Syntrophales bacterium]